MSRIVLIIDSTSSGGAHIQLARLKILLETTIPTHPQIVYTTPFINFLKIMMDIKRKNPSSILIIFNYKSSILTLLSNQIFKFKTIYSFRNPDNIHYSLNNKLHHCIFKFTVKLFKGQRIVFNNPEIQQLYAKSFHVTNSTYIPNIFEHPTYFPFTRSVTSCNVLFVGRDDKQKNLDDLISQITMINSRDTNRINLVAIYPRSGRQPLPNVDSYESYKEIKGNIPISALISFSRFEGSPSTIQECIMSGIPVIAREAPGIRIHLGSHLTQIHEKMKIFENGILIRASSSPEDLILALEVVKSIYPKKSIFESKEIILKNWCDEIKHVQN